MLTSMRRNKLTFACETASLKRAEDATTVKELTELYQLQYQKH
jgi:hypothetical protein